MKHPVLIGLGLVAAAAAVAAPLLRTDDSAQRCFTQQGDAAVAACTRAIQSGRFSGPALAAIYDNRAIELRQLGEFPRAIADYTDAIRHDGALTGAYTGRGLAYEGTNEVAKARADYQKALTLAPKSGDGAWALNVARGRLAARADQ